MVLDTFHKIISREVAANMINYVTDKKVNILMTT